MYSWLLYTYTTYPWTLVIHFLQAKNQTLNLQTFTWCTILLNSHSYKALEIWNALLLIVYASGIHPDRAYSRTCLERPLHWPQEMWSVTTGGFWWQVQLYWNVGPAENAWSVKTGGGVHDSGLSRQVSLCTLLVFALCSAKYTLIDQTVPSRVRMYRHWTLAWSRKLHQLHIFF